MQTRSAQAWPSSEGAGVLGRARKLSQGPHAILSVLTAPEDSLGATKPTSQPVGALGPGKSMHSDVRQMGVAPRHLSSAK